MVSSGTHFNSGCCFDYGNAETSGTDTGAGHMDTVNVSRDLSWADCHNGPGPGVDADLENGVFHWNKRSCNPSNVSGGPLQSLVVGFQDRKRSPPHELAFPAAGAQQLRFDLIKRRREDRVQQLVCRNLAASASAAGHPYNSSAPRFQ